MTNEEFNNSILNNYSHLKRFAFSLTKNIDDSLDLVQETCFKAIKHKDKLLDDNVKSWLFTILKNAFINKYRHDKHKLFTNIDYSNDYIINTDVSAHSILVTQELELYINNLKPNLKNAFQLFLDGFKYEEISEKLNVNLGTVKSRIFIARKQLMNNIKNENLNPYTMKEVKENKETNNITIKRITDEEYKEVKNKALARLFVKTLHNLVDNKITTVNKIVIETNISWPTMLSIIRSKDINKLHFKEITLNKMQMFVNKYDKHNEELVKNKEDKSEEIIVKEKIESKEIIKLPNKKNNEDNLVKPLTFWEAIAIAHNTKPSNILIHITIN